METTITLDEAHYKAVADSARAMGKTPEQYLHILIEAASRSFDDILFPVRKGFESQTDEELDALFERACKATRQPK